MQSNTLIQAFNFLSYNLIEEVENQRLDNKGFDLNIHKYVTTLEQQSARNSNTIETIMSMSSRIIIWGEFKRHETQLQLFIKTLDFRI